MSDGSVDIEVKLDDSQAISQADAVGRKIGKQVSSSVDSATSNVKKSSKEAVREIGTQMESYGASFSKAVTLPIVAAATATGAAAVKIDTALTGVRKTVDGTEEQYRELEDAAIEFSKTNAVDPAQILDIQALGAQLGYTIDELDMFGEVVSGLDIATNMDADTAATELAQFANIMGMAHDQTKNYGSTIVELGNNFATTEADISHMAMRIAGAGKQIGLSEADVLGLATALSSMGIEAEAGGTAVSTIMSQIDKAVATNSDSLKDWAAAAGMSADQFAKAWGENAVDALSMVLVGMDSAVESGGNMSVMLDELGINSIRQTDVLKRLASNSSFLGEAVETANNAWEENVALDKEVENRNASMAAQLQILWNKVQAVAIEVGEPLMESLIGIIDAADPLIDALASGAKAFSDLDEGGKQTVLTAIAIVAAFGPLTAGAGKLIKVAGNNADAWAKFGQNLKTVKQSIIDTANGAGNATANWGKFFAVGEKGNQTIYKVNRKTGEYVQTNSKLARALSTTTAGVKVQDAALKVQNVTMKAVSVTAKALGNVLKTIAPIAIFTAALEIIMAIGDALGKSSEKAERNKKATEGLTKSMDSYRKAYDKTAASESKAAEGAKHYAANLRDVKAAADEAAEKQAELSDKLSDLWAETGTNNALVDTYVDTIKDLTDGYDKNGNAAKLTAQEQAELQAAVDGLNRIMGTSYSVIDAQNGILSESTDVIIANADAWKQKALAEAASAATADLMKQHIENQTAIAEATRLVEQATSDLNNAQNDMESAMYAQKLRDAEAALADLESQDKAVVDEMDRMQDTIAELGDTYASSVESITAYLSATSEWGNALKNADIDTDAFSKSLSDLGISTKDLSKIMETEGEKGINGFIEAYKGGSESLNKWVKDHGLREVADTLEDQNGELKEAGREGAKAAADGFYQGFSENSQKIIDGAIKTAGLTREEFAKLADSLGVEGEEGATKLADGLNTIDAEEISKAIGRDFVYGLSTTKDSAKAEGQGISNNAKGGLQQYGDSPYDWGYHYGNQWVKGLSAGGQPGAGVAKSITDTVAQYMKFSVPKKGIFSGAERGGETSGEHLGQNFAQGLRNAKSDIDDAAEDAMNSAKRIMDGVVYEMNEQGELAAKGVVVGFEDVNPMAQIEESLKKGVSAINIASMMQGNSGDVYNNTRNQTNNFYSPISSPEQVARQLRLEDKYGLAGNR